MANVMAILQDVDKCVRCNGCYIGCKRTWKMKAADFGTRGVHRVAAHQRVVIKSQKKIDMGPFQRYSCWHCENPPCAGRCPFKAIKKEANGAVSVDFTKCNPNACQKQCVTDCQRGGYPKVGTGNYAGDFKAFKCTLCFGRAGAEGDLPTTATAAEITAVPEKAHQPTCVYTCPAKAMKWDTRANIIAELTAMKAAAPTDPITGRKLFYAIGDGSMFWVSSKYILTPPKADPFIEDHIAPMVSGLLSSPLAKAAVVPTLVVGGLMAISARRAENEEVRIAMEGEV